MAEVENDTQEVQVPVKEEAKITLTQSELKDFLAQAAADVRNEIRRERDEDKAKEEAALEAVPKGFKIKRDTKFGMWLVSYEGGGQVPLKLQGSFTEEKLAQRAIEAYVVERDKKESNDNAESFAA